ncbi:MAG: hypothetical protein JSS00_12575 [Proteobacteria bacterium]|nr:hypothetical protein [Pseudomonadota bacterium]
MRKWMIAAAAMALLGACNQLTGGGEPPLPPVQSGAQAPTQLPPAPSVQQANVTQQVRQGLEQQMTQLLDGYQGQFAQGDQRVQGLNDEIKAMQPGTDHRWRVSLQANTAYTFLGACDGDCHNVDIELIDMRTGGVVASDMLPDDYPVVNFTPAANGDYMARIILQNCTTAPCYTGMRALQQPAGGGGK